MNFLKQNGKEMRAFRYQESDKVHHPALCDRICALFSGQRYRNSFQRLPDAESCPHSARTDMLRLVKLAF